MKLMLSKKELAEIVIGVAFLLPNICGFLCFVAGPLVICMIMAFTNWNMELHNVFRNEPLEFVGLDNFRKLFSEPDFFRYLGNTLFFMMGIPFGVAGSLCAALVLSKNFRGASRRVWLIAVISVMMLVGTVFLFASGLGGTSMTLLIVGLLGLIMVIGSIGGQSIYRTLFYFPHFTAGVATYILWKKLYNPDSGPINNALRPVLNLFTKPASMLSPVVSMSIIVLILVLIVLVYMFSMWRNFVRWRDGESGIVSMIIASVFVSVPCVLAGAWAPAAGRMFPFLAIIGAGAMIVGGMIKRTEVLKCPPDRGMADAVIISGAVMVLELILLGGANVVEMLPSMAADGLKPPQWLADYYWAKPGIMLMGLWSAVGSNSMLLYLAGISGVPQELYEAADIDGANSFQRFWHVTWPQLANITFFILVMAVIHGLQGGFEMARTMTHGGPAGATTTLSYYIYSEGFATGRLGYASAVAWTLFAMTFGITVFNWKFGNRYTNE
jgi:multiple sugar transport system permease protein